MAEQLGLRYDARWQSRELWEELLDELRAIVAAVGLKQVAYDLDQPPSVLAHALAERDRHYLRAEWLPYLVMQSPGTRVVELIARWRGLEVKAPAVMTPEEKLRRIEAALDALPELGELVRRKAKV
jgi:hypothetical protein